MYLSQIFYSLFLADTFFNQLTSNDNEEIYITHERIENSTFGKAHDCI